MFPEITSGGLLGAAKGLTNVIKKRPDKTEMAFAACPVQVSCSSLV